MMIPYTKVGPTEHTIVTREFDIVRIEVPDIEFVYIPPPILAVFPLTFRIGAIIYAAILRIGWPW